MKALLNKLIQHAYFFGLIISSAFSFYITNQIQQNNKDLNELFNSENTLISAMDRTIRINQIESAINSEPENMQYVTLDERNQETFPELMEAISSRDTELSDILIDEKATLANETDSELANLINQQRTVYESSSSFESLLKTYTYTFSLFLFLFYFMTKQYKEAQAKKAEIEQDQITIFNNLDDGIAKINKVGQVLNYNNSFFKLLGHDESSLQNNH